MSKRWRVGLAILLGLAYGAQAQALMIDLTTDIKYLDLEIRALAVASVIVVSIDNQDPLPAYCEIDFKAGLERRRRRAKVPAEASVTVNYSVRSASDRVKVHARCRDPDEEKEIEEAEKGERDSDGSR